MKIAAGVMYIAPDGDILLLRRSTAEKNFGGHWALPGGGAEDGETPDQCAVRECLEEIGLTPPGSRVQIDECETPNGWTFYTFAHRVDAKFVPVLNDEHSGYAWAPREMLPEPMHPAVKGTIERCAEIIVKPHAMDAAMAFDRSIMTGEQQLRQGLAFDRATATVRPIDANGNMHVEVSNISKATVNPYFGHEIPNFKELGLEPGRVYQLLRDPEELRKAAHTFNNIPLLDQHVAVSAESHKPEHIVGSTGTDAEYAHPFLRNSLVVWAKKGIDAVQSEKKKELSSAYRYRADMTPGVFEGQKYDGVMRDIKGNHVALVEEGRAGSDVVVGDSVNPAIQERFAMSKNILSRKATVAQGALMVYLQPLLAMDAKIDLGAGLKGINAKNFAKKKGTLTAFVTKSVEGKLAQDASLDGLEKVIDMIEKTEVAGADEFPDKDDKKDAKAEDGDMDDDETAEDEETETEEEKAARLKKEAKDKKAADKKAADEAAKKDEDEKKAMDERIKLATDQAIAGERKNQQAITEAREKVRPYVGSLVMAFDSAGAVYRHVLTAMGKDVTAVKDDAALPIILEAIPVPGVGQQKKTTLAMDAAQTKSFAERFPHASKIRVSA